MPDYFQFQKLGLRANPFGTLTDEEWADIAVIPPEIETAFSNGDNLLILGERGRGKSTILRALCRQLQWQGLQAQYERLPPRKWHYDTTLSSLDAFAIDEAQRLALWNWSPLLHRVKNGMRLLMGTHRNDGWVFALSGIPIQVFNLETMITRQHLKNILNRRLEYFAEGRHPLISFDESAIDYLWVEYRDNLRGIEHFLYSVFEKIHEPTTITAQRLSLRF